MSTITTLHNTSRSKVKTALLDVTPKTAEVEQFTPTSDKSTDHDEATQHDNNSKKQRSNLGSAKFFNDFNIDYYPLLILPAIDLSSSTVSYGNGTLRVKTTTFEVKCHPDHATILKTFLNISFLNTDQNNYDNIQFVPYGLDQVAGEQVYKQQIVKQTHSYTTYPSFLYTISIQILCTVKSYQCHERSDQSKALNINYY